MIRTSIQNCTVQTLVFSARSYVRAPGGVANVEGGTRGIL